MEPANRHVLRDAAAGPGCPAVIFGLRKREAFAIGPRKGQHLLPEPHALLEPPHAQPRQPLRPGRKTVFRHGEDGRSHLANARAASARPREREICHHRTRRAVFIAVVEVVDVGGIEVHGLLDAPQSEGVGEKCIVVPGAGGEGGHVMQALDLVQH